MLSRLYIFTGFCYYYHMNDQKIIRFERTQAAKLTSLAQSFPIVAIVGPRQSGKTTLSRMVFPNHSYVSLEELDHRSFAEQDPRGFLAQYSKPVIIDEIQRVPSLLSYIQGQVDTSDTPGQYILTGSAHLMLLEKLTQSLAGRAALLKLHPLSFNELEQKNCLKDSCIEQLFTGFYPRIYKHHIAPIDWYPNYIQTYLEKDVREMVNIKNLTTFRRFIGLCAGRHGQLLDLSALANDSGISRQTAKEWISLLEASFLIYLLPPFHNNFSKRLIKSPKLYFYDSGLVCSLLKIETPEQLQTHYLRGAIFEGSIITEIIKHRYNLGLEPHVYFWRESNGNEVDCIVEQANQLLAIEIKSGQTINNSFFKGLKHWQKVAAEKPENSYLVYAGTENQSRNVAQVLGWKQLSNLLKNI